MAAILVGGKGTRLQSVLTDALPKPLAPIHNKPFLFYIIDMLASYHIKKIVLLTGHLHEKIQHACGDGSAWGVSIVYSQEHGPLGTGGAIKHAAEFLHSYDDFLLLNGDTFYDSSLQSFIETPLPKKCMGLIGATSVTDAAAYGTLQIDAKTLQIRSFLEKNQPSQGIVNAGIYKLATDVLQHIPDNRHVSLENEIFPQLLSAGYILKAAMLSGTFHDIGTPESYRAFATKMELT